MKKMYSTFTTLLVLTVAVVTTFAQNPERVTLTATSPAIVLEKRVAAETGKDFIINLKKGQRFKISYIEDTKNGTVDFGKFSLEENVDLEYVVEVTKDYLIHLYNPNRSPTSFRVFVSVESGSPQPATPTRTPKVETITMSFENPGDATATRTIQPGQTMNFVFPGETGLVAHVMVKDPSVSLTVDFCNRMIPLNEDETCKLKNAGEWVVMVRNDGTETRRFTIQGSLDTPGPVDDGGLDEVKINIPRGDTETFVEGVVGAEGSKIFLFNAKKGQTLKFRVYDDTNKLQVNFNKNPRKVNVDVRAVLNADGEWALYVDNPTNKDVSYRLWISIE